MTLLQALIWAFALVALGFTIGRMSAPPRTEDYRREVHQRD
jgi:hypothetical protein